MRAWTTLTTLACVGAVIAGCAENKPPETAYQEPAHEEASAMPGDSTVVAAEPRHVEEVSTPTDGTTSTAPATEPGPGVGGAPVGATGATGAPATLPPTRTDVAADNTKVNQRDRDDRAMTPMDQGNSSGDRNITAEIRKAVVADGSLSFTAKNVKIITKDGNVVLRGPVKSEAERASIQAAAAKVAGAARVTNQIEIAK